VCSIPLVADHFFDTATPFAKILVAPLPAGPAYVEFNRVVSLDLRNDLRNTSAQVKAGLVADILKRLVHLFSEVSRSILTIPLQDFHTDATFTQIQNRPALILASMEDVLLVAYCLSHEHQPCVAVSNNDTIHRTFTSNPSFISLLGLHHIPAAQAKEIDEIKPDSAVPRVVFEQLQGLLQDLLYGAKQLEEDQKRYA